MTITKILYHPITVLTLTMITIMFFFSLDKSSQKTQNSSENIKVLEHEVNQISNEIIVLEDKIADAESQQFKEKVIRNELLLQKPGEYILQIQLEDQSIDQTENQEQIEKEVSPQEEWIKLIF